MNKSEKFDLEERTGRFGEDIIELVKTIPKNSITNPLISQLVRAATSIGANYCEANNAQTKKECVYKISTCKKETRETQHWLKMVLTAVPKYNQNIKLYWSEAQELVLIFSKIIQSCKKKPN